ncbi:MAG: hypothetical protein QOI01_1376 [Mycobacterium sp.]|jgi:hypothetical protein|nr:hypothetical protein [Mycobacterium sp.]
MRIAFVLAMSALVAGCSGGTGGTADQTRQTPITGTPTSSPPSASPSKTTTKPSLAPASAPQQGAAIADVIRWIEAGTPADAAGYHSMTRDGESTTLDDGVAFTTAGTEANCVTNEYREGALACLMKLADPPPRPPGIETAWKDNWVDFTGAEVDVGSPHGDPGPFGDGTGAELPAGHTLAFGDYRCRSDATGLFCVNYAHQTAVKLSAAGVEGFGCLQKATPPADIGVRLSC